MSLEEVNSELLVLSKKTSLHQVEEDKDPEFLQIEATPESDDESEPDTAEIAAAQEAALKKKKAAQGSRNFLIGFFKDIGVEFKSGSREEIERSFYLGK